jgi:hypothetical protein
MYASESASCTALDVVAEHGGHAVTIIGEKRTNGPLGSSGAQVGLNRDRVQVDGGTVEGVRARGERGRGNEGVDVRDAGMSQLDEVPHGRRHALLQPK